MVTVAPQTWVEYVNASSTMVIAAFTVALFFAVFGQLRTSRNSERAWVLIEIGSIPNFQPDPNQPTVRQWFPAWLIPET